MDDHHRKLIATFAVMVFVVSAVAIGVAMTDDEADAAATGSASSPLSSLNLTVDEFGFATTSQSSWPSDPITTYYVAVGSTVHIGGYPTGDSYGFLMWSVTSGFGLELSNPNGGSIDGTITKAGTIEITCRRFADTDYTSGPLECSTIIAVDTDHVFDISIRASVSSNSVTTGGTITLTATTTPTTADNRRVTWEIQSGSQYGSITSTTNTSTGGTCVITGSAPGTMVIRCESVDGYASTTYTITVTQRMVTSVTIYQGFQSGDDLIITADVWPTNAYDRDVTWSVTSGSNLVTMRESHEYDDEYEMTFSATGNGSGSFTVRVSATDGSGEYQERTFYVNHVSFDANGGSGGPSDVYAVKGSVNSSGFLPTQEPSRSGMSFMGWSTSTSGSILYPAGGYASMRDGNTYYAIWGNETHINFNILYGAGGPPNETILVMEGETDWYYFPNDTDDIPTRPGYTFLGWSETANSTTASYEPGSRFEIAGGETYVFYDVWAITENEYYLAYNANGGTNAPPTQPGTNYGTENQYTFRVTSSEPTYEGHRFLGWSTTSTGTVEYEAGETITVPIGTTTLYAVWQEVHTFKIAYDANGGTGAPIPTQDTWETTADSVQIIISSTRPTWDEFHRFLGWSLDSEATTATILSGQVYTLTQTGTTTFYAVWEEIEGNTFTLHFDLQGGVEGPDDVVSVTVNTQTTVSVPSETPIWDQYRVFLGWAVESDSNVIAYQPGAQITLTESDTTLYAVWQRLPMPWTLHFDLGGGTWTSQDQTGTSADETFSFIIPDVEPTLEGFGFRGWSTTDGGSVEYGPGDSFIANEQETTLYAVWEQLALFTLSFDSNGGSSIESLTAYSLDSCTFTIPNTVPTLDGFLFQGWATVEGGAIDCQPGQTIEVTSTSTTLHAIWIERPSVIDFVLSFDDGEGSGAPASLHRTSSELTVTFTIPDVIPERDGFGFLGWSLSVGGGVDFEIGDEITVSTPSTTLYAVWIDESQLNSFTLNFSLGGGIGDFDPMTAGSLDSSYAFTIPSDIPVRTGFVFMGWAVPTNPSAVAYNPGDRIVVSSASYTLYAVWQPESIVFTLSFDVGDGASGEPSTITSMADGTVHVFTIPMDVPTMDGYRFMGWSGTYGGDADYQPGDTFVSGVRDATLYAVWKLIDDGAIHISNAPSDRTDVNTQFTYEVTIDADVPFTVSISGTAADWLNVNGHTIRGTPMVPGTYVLIVTVTDGEEYGPSSESFTIRVMESDVMEYRVEFVTSGGSDVGDQWILSGGTATAPADPVRDGFRFGGWYTEDGSRYDFSTAVGADMTLRAAWISDGSSAGDDDTDDNGDGDAMSYAWIIAGVLTLILTVAAAITRNVVVAIVAIVSALATIGLYLL